MEGYNLDHNDDDVIVYVLHNKLYHTPYKNVQLEYAVLGVLLGVLL